MNTNSESGLESVEATSDTTTPVEVVEESSLESNTQSSTAGSSTQPPGDESTTQGYPPSFVLPLGDVSDLLTAEETPSLSIIENPPPFVSPELASPGQTLVDPEEVPRRSSRVRKLPARFATGEWDLQQQVQVAPVGCSFEPQVSTSVATTVPSPPVVVPIVHNVSPAHTHAASGGIVSGDIASQLPPGTNTDWKAKADVMLQFLSNPLAQSNPQLIACMVNIMNPGNSP